MDGTLEVAPLVSVAMVTYNQQRFVVQAIESVLAQQTRFPIELVIGDDASSDGTARHIEALTARAPEVIRPIIRPINIGANQNFENVLKNCRGDFIAILEGDDYWTAEDKLQVQVDILRSHYNAVGVFHPSMYVDSFGKEIRPIYPKPQEVPREVGTVELLENAITPTASVMMRREALVSLPDSYENVLVRDRAMWVYASLRGPWLLHPRVMTAYRIHDGGAWNSLSRAARISKHIELFKAFAADLPLPFSAVARRQLTQLHLEASEEALVAGRLADARRELSEVILHRSDYRMREDGRRLIKALWRTLSPRTYRLAKQALGIVRLS
jgi:glycosyltransferase involved in cell wall biosynthesis